MGKVYFPKCQTEWFEYENDVNKMLWSNYI